MLRVAVFSLLLLTACSGSQSVPAGILPGEKMSNVLYDVIRADEMVDFLQLADSSYRRFSKRALLYDSIFSLHAVKKEEFQTSLKFYQGRPDLLKEVIDAMQKKSNDTAAQKQPTP